MLPIRQRGHRARATIESGRWQEPAAESGGNKEAATNLTSGAQREGVVYCSRGRETNESEHEHSRPVEFFWSGMLSHLRRIFYFFYRSALPVPLILNQTFLKWN
jgi:hypothetical protein